MPLRWLAFAGRLWLGLTVGLGTAVATEASAGSARTNHWSLQALRSVAELEASLWQQFALVTNRWAKPRPGHAGTDQSVVGHFPKISHPIDAFVLARLATNGLSLSPPADRVTLIRRLSFDLLGLPPSPAEIDAFVTDDSPEATSRLVDRFLASPRYGERWGRHWLDVARYTESQGFEYDKLRDNAWHFRDYVIRSFNEDKPYDRFMQEQVAGDVLEPVTSDGIVGASLLVCGPWDEAGNSQANQTQRAVTREEELEDLVGTVGQTFLGLTLNCARCHAHKFDPIPTEEYYRVKAVFEGVKHGERSIAGPAEVRAREARVATLKQEIATAQATISRLDEVGSKLAAARRKPGVAAVIPTGPTPYLRWDFAETGGTSTTAGAAFELKGGAVVRDGRLQLPAEGAFLQSAPLGKDIAEKTLEAWVSLANLQQGGGAAISIESQDGRVFDAIVFGERQAGKWMAGSSGFERTRDLDVPVETAAPGTFVHLAVVYRADRTIEMFRNGQPYGQPYRPESAVQTYRAGQARVLIGQRHTGGGRPWLTGAVRRAVLYDRALRPEEIAASFRSDGLSIPTEEILASLNDVQRAEHSAALAAQRSARAELDGLKPFPVSYAGVRVQPAPTKVLRRGDVKSPGDVIAPAALSAIAELAPEFGLAVDAPEAERRRAFARWLAHPRNPLPARVMANRVWQFHFGQGLVSTPNDFGVSGARPTHPELLDWLAAKFIESGWSVKALHRLIVSSRVYQQASSLVSAQYSVRSAQSEVRGAQGTSDAGTTASLITGQLQRAMELDADNQLLWRYPARRLEAEAVRDAALAVSGQLNLALGGPSFRPFDALKFPANAYVPADKVGPEFNRRTVYRMNVNSGKEPLLDAFDCPDPSVKTPRRGVTTTPLQALALMNNSFVQRQAGHLVERVMGATNQELPRAVELAYRLALGRRPTSDEARRALEVAQSRSLTNVCWALLNSTEFVYVR